MKIKKYLYLIQCDNSNFYKVGISEDPEERLKALQVGCPYPLVLIYKKYLKNAFRVEKALHKSLKNKQEIGEWFRLSKDEIKLIQQGEEGINQLLLIFIPEIYIIPGLHRIQTINKIRAKDGLPLIKQ